MAAGGIGRGAVTGEPVSKPTDDGGIGADTFSFVIARPPATAPARNRRPDTHPSIGAIQFHRPPRRIATFFVASASKSLDPPILTFVQYSSKSCKCTETLLYMSCSAFPLSNDAPTPMTNIRPGNKPSSPNLPFAIPIRPALFAANSEANSHLECVATSASTNLCCRSMRSSTRAA